MPYEKITSNLNAGATLLDALANASRLQIACLLLDGEMSVGDIVSEVGISQSALSQHLAIFRELKLVTTRRVGQTIFYRCDNDAVRLIIEGLAEIFEKGDKSNSSHRNIR